MRHVDLLRALPKTKRNIQKRADAKDPAVIAIAKQYGEMYWDGPREYGYGGYRDDGRWHPVARDIIDHYGLKPGMRVLDVGCGKGFLVKDLMTVCPGLQAFGLDISEYALMHCEPEVVGRLHLGNCLKLPFPDGSFAATIAINVVHNLDRAECITAVKEIQRLSPGRAYIQVDSYRTPQEEQLFLSWVLTAKTHHNPSGWRPLFEEAGYTGDYYWTIIEA